ncbi:MAG: regulator of protease activity HflC (stomatin/prohibitin superfamily) [Alphaproteobacteria bacterium]|jgi:regulator of protease activity HflC (stomatin/prohibitin superfamily)
MDLATIGMYVGIVFGVLWLVTCFSYVPGKKSYVMEGLKGPKEKALGRGLHMTAPWPFTRKVGVADHQWQKSAGTVMVRSNDNAIFELPYELQYRAIDDVYKAVKAVFELANPKGQMKAFIDNELPQFIRNKAVDDVYGDRSAIQSDLLAKLKDEFDDYGFEVKLLIQDPVLDVDQRAAYNNVRTAQLRKTAATDEAAAAKILLVGGASAEAESKKLQGKGMADMRQAVAKGMKAAMASIKLAAPDLSDREVMDFLLEVNRLDTMSNVGSHGNMVLMDLNKTSQGSPVLPQVLAAVQVVNKKAAAEVVSNTATA